MGWDHRPEATVWTQRTLAAVASKDPVLANRIPADIESWCPAYDTATVEQRRAFVSLVQKARTLAPAEPASATLKPAPAAAP